MSERLVIPTSMTDAAVDAEIRRRSRRSFSVGAIAAAAGLGGWKWLQSRELEDGIPWPFRRVLEFNERLARATFNPNRMSPEFSLKQAREPRVNGTIGLREQVNARTWKIVVRSEGGPLSGLSLTVADVRALPRVDMVTEFKCVEGWSEVVHWTGARLSDLMAKFRLGTRSGQAHDLHARAGDLLPYVGMSTPGGDYFVGLDMASAVHPQTLLCYEMNGAPLTPGHGGPVRLVIPAKYGIKNIKQVGAIEFTDSRPADYWAKRGYDWYAGH